MDDKEFSALADSILARIEASLEASGADIDFVDGSKIIVNRHGPAREIWVAARAGGFHFRWDGVCWRDTRDGTELMGKLAELVSQQAGDAVRLD